MLYWFKQFFTSIVLVHLRNALPVCLHHETWCRITGPRGTLWVQIKDADKVANFNSTGRRELRKPRVWFPRLRQQWVCVMKHFSLLQPALNQGVGEREMVTWQVGNYIPLCIMVVYHIMSSRKLLPLWVIKELMELGVLVLVHFPPSWDTTEFTSLILLPPD